MTFITTHADPTEEYEPTLNVNHNQHEHSVYKSKESDETSASKVGTIHDLENVRLIDLEELRKECQYLLRDDSTWNTDNNVLGMKRILPNPDQITQECQRALRNYFSGQQIMEYIMPMPPVLWQEIFTDIQEKTISLVSTLSEPNCQVPRGSYRSKLRKNDGGKCDSSSIREIAILMESCASVFSNIREMGLTIGWDYDSAPDYNLYGHYKSGYDLQRYNSDLLDLKTLEKNSQKYVDLLAKMDSTFYKTAYLRMSCYSVLPEVSRLFNEQEETKTQILPTNVWAVAARLGDPIALANYVPRGSDGFTFMLINPIQTSIQYAKDCTFTHINAFFYKSRWNSQLRDIDSSILTGIADVKTFSKFLKDENIKCPGQCNFVEMNSIFSSMSQDDMKKWNRFFISNQVDKLNNDRVYWALVADGLAQEYGVKINRRLLYERFVDKGMSRLNVVDQKDLRMSVDFKVREIIASRKQVNELRE